MEYSNNQKNIFNNVQRTNYNIVVSASAGSGKTTTIEHCLSLISKKKDSIYLAFNNRIVDEMKQRKISSNTHITTMHSLGWRAILKTVNGAKLNKSKSYKHIERQIKKLRIPIDKKIGYYFYISDTMVDLVRQNLISEPEDVYNLALKHDLFLEDLEVDLILSVLKSMNRDNLIFDFTDMIYRPVKDKIKMPMFDYVFIDESQDLSKCQQVIVEKIKKRKGRMIAVGDPYQAIYGFAGADHNSYNNLKNMFQNTIELPLSVNYRCGKNIVREAQKINDQIQYFDKSKDGIVRYGTFSDISKKDWVLCRNLKPLVVLNLWFLSKKINSYIKGQEIGLNLIRNIEKYGKNKVVDILKAYNKDIYKEIVKLKGKGIKNPINSEKIVEMFQKLETLKVLGHGVSTKDQLIKKIENIFKDKGEGIVLSTIHKSKGLENKKVYFLLPELIPSKFATKDWQLEQEKNLKYVAITRAKEELIYIDIDTFDVIENEIMELIKEIK